jgi:hypothetical protein
MENGEEIKVQGEDVAPNGIVVERQEIRWPDFEGRFVKLDVERPRLMVLANPGQIDKDFGGEITHSIEFDVLELDGVKYEKGEKVFNTSSRRLIMRLKPIIEKMGNGSVKLSITKVGDKFDTNYLVKVIEQ